MGYSQGRHDFYHGVGMARIWCGYSSPMCLLVKLQTRGIFTRAAVVSITVGRLFREGFCRGSSIKPSGKTPIRVLIMPEPPIPTGAEFSRPHAHKGISSYLHLSHSFIHHTFRVHLPSALGIPAAATPVREYISDTMLVEQNVRKSLISFFLRAAGGINHPHAGMLIHKVV